MPNELLQLGREILAHPEQTVERGSNPADMAALIPRLLTLIFCGAGLFGLAVGSYHGGWQLLYATIKMPLVLLVPLLVTLPALRALYAQPGRPVSTARAAMAGLVGTARVAVLSTALVPLLWLLFSLQAPYPLAILAMAGGLALVGLPGLAAIGRSLAPDGAAGSPTRAATLLLVGLTIPQTGWLLRPFVVLPGARLSLLQPVCQDVFHGLADHGLGRVRADEQGLPSNCAPQQGAER